MAFPRLAALVCLALVGRSLADDARQLLSPRGSKKCDGDYDSLAAGDTCTTSWSQLVKGSHQLRATEPAVGHAWVVAQMGNHFGSAKKSKKWFDKHTFPVVLGDDDFYVTDRHHHAAAIHLTDDSDIFDLDITLSVVCDLRSYTGDNFWAEMTKRHYNLLLNRPADSPFAIPTPVAASTLPTGWDLTAFTDNMWRSLAGFASHVSDDDNRCYRKPCTFFVDYEWAYTMNYAVEKDPSLWPINAAVSASDFKSTFEKLPYNQAAKDVDLDAWNSVAEAVLPFCHSTTIENFSLPASYFPDAPLSGWSTVPVLADPECPYDTCSVRVSSAVVV